MGSRGGVARKLLRALDVGVGASCGNESNLSRTLTNLRDAGIVEFEKRGGRTRAPRLIARHSRTRSGSFR